MTLQRPSERGEQRVIQRRGRERLERGRGGSGVEDAEEKATGRGAAGGRSFVARDDDANGAASATMARIRKVDVERVLPRRQLGLCRVMAGSDAIAISVRNHPGLQRVQVVYCSSSSASMINL